MTWKAGHERNTEKDHDSAHDQRAEDSPDQDAVLRARRNAKILKDENEDKDVVDAERVFDEVAGEKIEAVLGAAHFPDEQIEKQRKDDPNEAAMCGGSHR